MQERNREGRVHVLASSGDNEHAMARWSDFVGMENILGDFYLHLHMKIEIKDVPHLLHLVHIFKQCIEILQSLFKKHLRWMLVILMILVGVRVVGYFLHLH